MYYDDDFRGVVDAYSWPVNVSQGTAKAGTEELNFYSETGTYNRDDIPCVDFSVSPEFIESIDCMIEKLQKLREKREENSEIKEICGDNPKINAKKII